MSLNNILLPAPLLADLYRQSLVESIARPVPYLGKNEKKVLVVVNHAGIAYLPDGELRFLTNVLSACGLGLADVAIVNWHSAVTAGASAVVGQLRPAFLILFDVDGADFNLTTVRPYALGRSDNFGFVTAPSLTAIESDTEEKKRLWAALKQLFGL